MSISSLFSYSLKIFYDAALCGKNTSLINKTGDQQCENDSSNHYYNTNNHRCMASVVNEQTKRHNEWCEEWEVACNRHCDVIRKCHSAERDKVPDHAE